MENIIKYIKILFSLSTVNISGVANPNILILLKKIKKNFTQTNIITKLDQYNIDSSDIKHGNLLLYAKTKPKTKYILFHGHIDTVPAPQNEPKHTVNRQYLIGRGAVDMKGNLAAMLSAFEQINALRSKTHSPAILITGDEEANSFEGIKTFIKRNKTFIKKIDMVITGEPTDLCINTNHRGIFGAIIEKNGQTGHSAFPQEKLIENSIPLLQSIKNFISDSQKIHTPALGKTVGATTIINAGTKGNQLPDSIKIEFNLRTVKPDSVYKTLFAKQFKNLLKGYRYQTYGFSPTQSIANNAIVQLIQRAVKKTGISYKTGATTFFTEANILNQQGIPAIVFGAGNPRLAHTLPPNEKIKLRDLKLYSDILVNIFKI
ncbi:TPA: hypothetical protein DF272_05040 [Candidatus Falkowbacteria bacterium]|nr:hypothetical protein [Candidatus Falkowbacteria bacterium]